MEKEKKTNMGGCGVPLLWALLVWALLARGQWTMQCSIYLLDCWVTCAHWNT